MNITIFNSRESKNPITCDFCRMPFDGTEPAESLIPEIAEGKYGKLVVAHTRCASKAEKKMHHVGTLSVFNVSKSARPQHSSNP